MGWMGLRLMGRRPGGAAHRRSPRYGPARDARATDRGWYSGNPTSRRGLSALPEGGTSRNLGSERDLRRQKRFWRGYPRGAGGSARGLGADRFLALRRSPDPSVQFPVSCSPPLLAPNLGGKNRSAPRFTRSAPPRNCEADVDLPALRFLGLLASLTAFPTSRYEHLDRAQRQLLAVAQGLLAQIVENGRVLALLTALPSSPPCRPCWCLPSPRRRSIRRTRSFRCPARPSRSSAWCRGTSRGRSDGS